MFIVFDERPSDSPFVERVWRCHSERAGTFSSVADCRWEMVVTRYEGRSSFTVRGPESRATGAECPADGEWLAIRFKVGTFMPKLTPRQLRDRNDVTLPNASDRAFWLNGSSVEYPDFENADDFVRRLVNQGLITMDRPVADALRGEGEGVHVRTAQRRFLNATGMTRSAIRQIERARHATNLLRAGVSILDTAHEAGYFDQAHLTRSLTRYVGQTPAQIARKEGQLSFLYKTGTPA